MLDGEKVVNGDLAGPSDDVGQIRGSVYNFVHQPCCCPLYDSQYGRSLHPHKDPVTGGWRIDPRNWRLEHHLNRHYIGISRTITYDHRPMLITAATTRRFIRPPTLSGVWEAYARG
jgi:hypothetical protein